MTRPIDTAKSRSGQIHERFALPVDLLVEASSEAVLGTVRRERSLTLRVSFELPSLDPWQLLSWVQPREDGVFAWFDPEEGRELIAFGALRRLTCSGPERFAWLAEACSQTSEELLAVGAPLPLWVGGLAFDTSGSEDARDGAWAGWPDGALVLPEVLVEWRRGQARPRAALAVRVEPGDSVPGVLDDLARLGQRLAGAFLEPPAPRPSHGDRLVDPARPQAGESDADRTAWVDRVEAARALIAAGADQRGALDKVVLARSVTHASEADAFDPVATARALHEDHPLCTIFMVPAPRHGAEGTFVGATPERLLSRKGLEIQSVALAGTAPRGAEADSDAALGRALLESEKDRHEQHVVTEAICESLGPLVGRVETPDAPGLARFAHVQHLRCEIRGELSEPRHVLEVAAALHPTPAVGGRPRADALAWLTEHEGLERGWYAGPVGWVDAAGDGVFSVALRSALLQGDRAHAFAGAGIVEASEPEAEWRETRLKLRAAAEALRLRRVTLRLAPEAPALRPEGART